MRMIPEAASLALPKPLSPSSIQVSVTLEARDSSPGARSGRLDSAFEDAASNKSILPLSLSGALIVNVLAASTPPEIFNAI